MLGAGSQARRVLWHRARGARFGREGFCEPIGRACGDLWRGPRRGKRSPPCFVNIGLREP